MLLPRCHSEATLNMVQVRYEKLFGHLQISYNFGDVSDFLGVVLQPRATQLPLIDEKQL